MTRRDDVLAALRAAGGGGVSGESLAGDLGVSRVAIAKHVAALRALGYQIEAAPGTGYRLMAVPDAPVPEEIRPRLANPLWVRVEGAPETRSTNDDARALARDGAPEGTAVVAGRQLAGRGRLGRSWASPEGGVYVSAVLRPGVSPADAPSLALAVALGAALGLEGLGARAQLKWPNDLLADGGKLAGVLLEMSAEADRIEWLVAGIGVNVAEPAEPFPGAACLTRQLPSVGRAEVAAAVLDGIAEAYGLWRAEGFSALREAYEDRLALTGREVSVANATGEVLAAGCVTGVDEQGRLVLETTGGTRRVSAGEVTLRA